MRSTCVLLLSLALTGCREETPTHPFVKSVKPPAPPKTTTNVKEPAPGEKDPPKYKVQ